ncbi:hypothetical protein PC9H_004591 [Pleurotus ostreatus]|uniref:Methionine aminopeptidase n=1 Tax=Pleurotus ostreatus TaxID=5322 RepID=A0A8H6ZY88_PLEOS|nr:uncharacterized protein PC9H_004591 [Pleurotus ostreatus]KAF7432649.1 hypothetical protein PC9H_004591 [Pleurotus ostreatus]KAJ8698834.1 hypothetical protein PTI98_005501 [Pleurotus ostreatus]
MATFTRRLTPLRFRWIDKANRSALSATGCRRYSQKAPALEASDFDFGEYSVILPEEPFVFGVSHITPRLVPEAILRPPYASSTKLPGDPYAYPPNACIPLGGSEEQRVRKSGALAKAVRDYAGTLVKVGATTNSIDAAIHEFIIAKSAYPSPLLYRGFPRSCCTSINNIITHGIPDDRPLEDGDIINIDITVYLDGFHGDTSQTFLVGEVDAKGRELVDLTNKALHHGIAACGPGMRFRDIGQAIRESIKGFDVSISPQFTGHGIGSVFHHPPWIIHDINDEPGVMAPGHCFTIEPALIQGSKPTAWIFPDGWTASTENCARSAQAEHMVLITPDGVDVLTA